MLYTAKLTIKLWRMFCFQSLLLGNKNTVQMLPYHALRIITLHNHNQNNSNQFTFQKLCAPLLQKNYVQTIKRLRIQNLTHKVSTIQSHKQRKPESCFLRSLYCHKDIELRPLHVYQTELRSLSQPKFHLLLLGQGHLNPAFS